MQMNMSTWPTGKNVLPFLMISPQSWRRSPEDRLHWATPLHVSQKDESLLHLDKTPCVHSPATEQDNLGVFGRPALGKKSVWGVKRRGPAVKWGIKHTPRLCQRRSESGHVQLKPV